MMWLFIFSGFIACAGKHVGASCPVVMNPPAVVVGYGNSFSVNCSSLSNRTDGMGWESPTGGTGLITGVTSVPLNIKSLQYWSLVSQCYIDFNSGQQCTQNLPVTVYKMPDTVTMSQLSLTGPMVEGETYSIQCDIANVAPARNLSVNWYKGNELFHQDTFDETSPSPVNKTSILKLTAHRNDNGAQIWCEAKLNFIPAGPNPLTLPTKPQEVTVLYPPTFTKPANETVEVKTELLLNCTATGNPAPVYSWHYPQPLVQTNENKAENQSILALSFHLPGTYSCRVSNSQGTKTKYFTVIQEPRNRTTFVAIVAGFAILGVVLFIASLFFVTPNGTFSLNKGSYLPASSGPV